jgi:hypothetical protein
MTGELRSERRWIVMLVIAMVGEALLAVVDLWTVGSGLSGAAVGIGTWATALLGLALFGAILVLAMRAPSTSSRELRGSTPSGGGSPGGSPLHSPSH